ncbi:AAA family ATPase [Roseinatronobacter alkalisoli]|uniref:AAA family ATPase n=1 Tax=Roseinatronobacter alkalisoli TaxID=3028235 RepID=A0ABT5T7B8_9RHOB|nr:AAA family ATPase [Roseinatronobacter sp. HJB301]MDD7969843.1 AAA family ATPase [Roseinatronobacter sp. HJB301]
MRLDSLNLTAYGHFTDATLTLPAPAQGTPDLHIVFGPNEAGKSTLLAAWLDFLFGFPNQTQYDFLHEKRALRVRARLRDAHGTPHALARIKGNVNTLLDAATNQPVAESTLGALLGGLERGSYTTMFSLDEATLVRGGDSILASEGDLGQLLFQATAGLAELGDRLRDLRTQNDEWFRPRARKTQLHAHKDRLKQLVDARKAVDLQVSGWRRLCDDVQSAEDAYQHALNARAQTQTLHDAHARDLAALPVLERFQDEKSLLAGLPAPVPLPPEWVAGLPGWVQENTRLAALIPQAQAALDDATQQLDGLDPDQTALRHVPDLDGLQARFGAIAKEQDDLPRRLSQRDIVQAQITQVLDELGPGAATQDAAQLAPPVIDALSALITQDAELSHRAWDAAQELEKANETLADLTGNDSTPPPSEDRIQAQARLQALLPDLRANDPSRAANEAQTAWESARVARDHAIADLLPWRGVPDDLHAIDLPAPDTLRALQARMTDTESTLRDADAEIRRLDALLARAQAGIGPDQPPEAQDMTAARDTRDRLWAAHCQQMDAHSAAAFAAAMATHDRLAAQMIAAARMAERLEQLRSHQADLALATGHRKQVAAALAGLHEQVAALWARIAPPDGATRSLADLLDWQARRSKALQDCAQEKHARAILDTCRGQLCKAQQMLARAIQAMGHTPDESADYALLLAQAEALNANAARLAERHAALTRAQGDVTRRQNAADQIQTARTDWQTRWTGTLAQTWIAPTSSVPQVRAILKALETLAPLRNTLHELTHRIDSIRKDERAFCDQLAALANELGMPSNSDLRMLWPQLRDRLRAAQDMEARRKRLSDARDKARADLNGLMGRRQALDQATAALRAKFDTQSLDRIAAQIATITRANDASTRLKATQAELARHLHCDDIQAEITRLQALDPQATAVERDTLAATLKAQEQAQREAYARLAAAQKERDSAGLDDAAAQLEEERQTLILQIKDEAHDYLARQAGILAVEQALRRYRDTHRSSMMERAGRAFAALTCGRYSGLTTRPDGTRELLIAQEARGAAKPVDTLSKGTGFQLYLALRIAGYLELAGNRPMVPFIADDIMESFDDARAAAAFGLLGDMARKGQVIYLTHHAHLCDIAQRACPDAHIHNLHNLLA